MRLRLRQTEPDWAPLLHQRASAWYERNGFTKEAVDHALRAKDFERAAQVIEEQMDGGFERIDQLTLGRWLAAVPEDFVLSYPPLTILQAWHRFNSGQLDAAARSLQGAEELLAPNRADAHLTTPDEGQPAQAKHATLLGQIAAIRAFMTSFKEDTPLTIAYAQQALEHFPEQELGWRSAVFITLGDAYANQGQMAAAREARANALATGKASGDTHILMIANLRLAEILKQQGELQQVIELCERQFKQADDSGLLASAVVGWLLGIWGEVLAARNYLSRAIEQSKRGASLTAQAGDVFYAVKTNLSLVSILFSSGDISGAEDVVHATENAAREYDLPRWALRQLAAWQVRIWLAQDKLELAAQWVSKSGLDLAGEPSYEHEAESIALARILIAQGRLDEADGLLQRLRAAAEAGGRTSAVIEILILRALAAQAGGNTRQAIATLKTALALAEPGGFIRIFVDEGQPMATLLYAALSRGVATAYVQQLLAAFPTDEAKSANPPETQALSSELIEPLSEREIEVLQLIAEGLTNQEIANRLYLSLNTVKVHARNIYGKLDAHHRASAVAKARAWGILSSA